MRLTRQSMTFVGVVLTLIGVILAAVTLRLVF